MKISRFLGFLFLLFCVAFSSVSCEEAELFTPESEQELEQGQDDDAPEGESKEDGDQADGDQEEEDGEEEEDEEEEVAPLEFLLLNTITSSGMKQGISYFKEASEQSDQLLYVDYFGSENSGEAIMEDPVAAMIIDDFLIVACGGSPTPFGNIEVLDAATSERVRSIELATLQVATFASLGDGKILVGGTNKSGTANVVVVDYTTGAVEEIALTSFNVQYVVVAGGKALVYGTIPSSLDWSTMPPVTTPATYHFAIFDLDNLTSEGMRTVLEDYSAYVTVRHKFVADESGNIWLPTLNSDGSGSLSCFSTATEQITSSVAIPNASSAYATDISMTSSSDGDYIYVRVHEAIYDYSVAKGVINPDPMVSFNYQSGNLRDLVMTRDGRFLFIDRDGDVSGGVVYEVTKSESGVWSKCSEGWTFEGVAPNTIVLK